MYSCASPTVLILSASSSEISIPNSSSRLMMSSTRSSESALRSSTNEASGFTSPSSTPSCSTMIFLRRSYVFPCANNLPPPGQTQPPRPPTDEVRASVTGTDEACQSGTKESRARAALYGEPMTDPWRELYDREYPRLVRALVAIGRDPAGAEDAAQEAFVKAHRTGLDHIAKPAAWLLVVGSREVFRRRRRSRRERELWASLPERHDAVD